MQIGEYSPYIQYSVNISLIFFGVFEQVSAEELASAQSKLREIFISWYLKTNIQIIDIVYRLIIYNA